MFRRLRNNMQAKKARRNIKKKFDNKKNGIFKGYSSDIKDLHYKSWEGMREFTKALNKHFTLFELERVDVYQTGDIKLIEVYDTCTRSWAYFNKNSYGIL